jgi:exopolysaccharide biosynthesis protein
VAGDPVSRERTSVVTPAVASDITTTDTKVATYKNSKATINVIKRTMTGVQPRPDWSGKHATGTIVAFIADVVLTDGTALQSAFAKGTFARNSSETVSVMAKNNKAVLAINGDYSSFRMNGIVISEGKSYLDKGKRQGLATRRDGSALVYDETKTTAAKLLDDNVWLTQSFGPSLIQDGKVPAAGIEDFEVDFDVKPGTPGSIQGPQPRTGIGYVEKNHFVLIVVDGRGANNSQGVTMTEFAEMFITTGATLAYNIDGGQSASMYFNSGILNKPTDINGNSAERPTSNLIYIAK